MGVWRGVGRGAHRIARFLWKELKLIKVRQNADGCKTVLLIVNKPVCWCFVTKQGQFWQFLVTEQGQFAFNVRLIFENQSLIP